MSGGETPGFGLVMPFVVTRSNGGPFDDAAYVAGAEFGQLDEHLRQAAAVRAIPQPRYINSANVPQVDLLAMHHGFTVTFEPWDEHPDEWTMATFGEADRG